MAQISKLSTLQLLRAFSNLQHDGGIQTPVKRKDGTGVIGQCNFSSLRQQDGWKFNHSKQFNDHTLDVHTKFSHHVNSKASSWIPKSPGRLPESDRFKVQLEAQSGSLQEDRQSTRTTYHRQIRRDVQHSASKVQFIKMGPRSRSSGRNGPEVGHTRRDKLLQSAILDDTKSAQENPTGTGRGHNHSPSVERSNVVSKTVENVNNTSSLHTQQQIHVPETRKETRTVQKSVLEDSCLESVWKIKLKNQGWKQDSIQKFMSNWAQSTLRSYSKIVDQFKNFCDESDAEFPDFSSAILAEFLCHLAAQTGRPKSILNIAVSAITSLCEALNKNSPLNNEIAKLVTGLIKSGTTEPMKRSRIMPVKPFLTLFEQWKGNWGLTLEQLRLKCLSLLAFSLMLRPSDMAPNAQVINEDGSINRLIMTINQLQFLDDGSCIVLFHGIKNDYSRDGFEVVLRPATNPRLDPVLTLKNYIHRTQYVRPENGAIFLSLKKPYGPITSNTIARILEQAIFLAGLKNQGFSAKSFRPTGASNAIDAGLEPDFIRKVGRWKSKETFENHYVHSKPQSSFTDKILQQPQEQN